MGTFFSWNCRGIRSKLSDIKTILNKFHPICLGIQETFLTPSIPIKLRGYNCTRKDTDTGSRSSGGVCLLTSNLYPSTPITLHTPLQAVAVRYPTIENLVAFKKAKALARRIRRRSQRESWIKFVSSITSSTSTKLLWKKVKAANGIYSETSIPVLKTGNLVHSSPLEVANILGHAFAQVSAIDSYSSEFLEIKNLAERLTLHFNDRNTLTYNSEFRMFELKTALSQAGNTSPGPDGITYSMLRHLNEISLSNLLLLFNRIWTEHKYPKQWSEATVIPILKPGKDPLNPLNYRPIALTNCVCKTFERMVNAPSLYVDDLQISCEGSNMNLIEQQLQNAVNKVVTWCNKNGHAISPEKSQCVHFCKKRNMHLDPVVKIRDTPIPVVTEVRFLGVTFDGKLTFLPHILNLRKRCEKN
ncbi:uncharacterized protein LOC129962953 [Argiope bruennichi]|uniref:uncharacterized protein LOC129962953 n=1 Tax=Argiope bruennichi TaxID=94029 RepID=UPI0024957C8A|nr:uncharacterized protein LOC129962953 [Argiope bruennichi]